MSAPPAVMGSSSSTTTDVDDVGGLIVIHGFLVFFMLELGFGRAKNVQHVLLKNMTDIMLCALTWWAVGFAFSHGSKGNGFIGYSGFFQDSSDPQQRPWFFSWTFAVSTVTIVSGCLAERTSLITYPIITVLLSAWVHPVAAHWVWSTAGWTHNVSRCRFLDFAGGCVVHSIGGLTGLVGAYMCGPRLGRFEDGPAAKPLPGHDISRVSLGTLMLWFGWYGFNCGSLYSYNPAADYATDRVAIGMTLSGATAGLTALTLHSLKQGGTFDLSVCCNGLLTGLVAATGSCGFVPSWASVAIGALAGVTYIGLSRALDLLHIDDPLNSSVIHVGGGMLGVLCNGAFADPSYVALLGPAQSADGYDCGGFFLSRADGGLQLGMQLLGGTVICAWAVFWAFLVFYVLSRLGRLRVDQATELAGIDNIEHGGPAYPEFTIMMGPTGGNRA